MTVAEFKALLGILTPHSNELVIRLCYHRNLVKLSFDWSVNHFPMANFTSKTGGCLFFTTPYFGLAVQSLKQIHAFYDRWVFCVSILSGILDLVVNKINWHKLSQSPELYILRFVLEVFFLPLFVLFVCSFLIIVKASRFMHRILHALLRPYHFKWQL